MDVKHQRNPWKIRVIRVQDSFLADVTFGGLTIMTLTQPRWDNSPEVEARVEALLARLTLADKIDLVSGLADVVGQPGALRPDSPLPSLTLSDGPGGVRQGGPAAVGRVVTAFPAPLALAATWDPDLARIYGEAVGVEMRATGHNVMLGPAIDLARAPLAGRTFESFGEDPLLQARLVVPEVEAIQAQAVQVCLKHYIANNQEHRRNSIDVRIDERTLRELYLPPFAAAVGRAGAASVMGSYNRINGTFACENPFTLTTLLREELGFKGWVMSDFMAIHDTVAPALAGLDWELGPRHWGAKLLEAVEGGQVPGEQIYAMVRRILRATIGLGLIERPLSSEIVPAERHALIAREIAEQAIVLLKNDGLLPLDPAAIKSIAVIGPDADNLGAAGGGSGQVVPFNGTSVVDAVRARLSEHVRVAYAPGVDAVGPGTLLAGPTAVASSVLRTADGGRGLRAEYWNTPDFAGEPKLTRVDAQVDILRGPFGLPGMEPISPKVVRLPNDLAPAFSARWTGKMIPPSSGTYTLSLTCLGSGRLWVNDALLIEAPWPGSPDDGDIEKLATGGGAQVVSAPIDLVAGVPVSLRIEYAADAPGIMFVFGGQIRFGWLTPEDTVLPDIAAAAELAAGCDVAVVVAHTFESEFFDRTRLELPNDQDRLIRAVVAANPRTAVVLMNAGPVQVMPWEPEVSAIVEAWFAGQEQGEAVARVLFGDVNPSGRLPLTFPRSLVETPLCTAEQYPGVAGALHYTEGLGVGYRGYDQRGIEPQYPFGFGLSYTAFEYGDLAVMPLTSAGAEAIEVSFELRNVGKRAGVEIAQVYLESPAAADAPPQRLVGWARVPLEAGEAKRVVVTIDPASDEHPCSRWTLAGWTRVCGDYVVRVSASSRDHRLTRSFKLE